MRVIIGLALGLLAGFGAATWFYAHGGNIVIAGRAIMPDKAPLTADPTPKSVAAAPSKAPRVVVRDITSEVGTPPSVTSTLTPTGLASDSTFMVIKWPSW
jgi:hypothetical protein